MKGFTADIFKHEGRSCAGGSGISDLTDSVTIIDPRIPAMYEPTPEAPGVRIKVKNVFGTDYIYAVPLEKPEGMTGPMMGGSFIYCCDSRFRELSKYPIPLHDRFETQETYDLLSR